MVSKVNIEDIAQYTILRLNQLGATVNPLKLQKVLYYMQAWHMVYFDKELLFDDVPEAWVNGPVYRKVYNKYKNIGIYDQIGVEMCGCKVDELSEMVEALNKKMNLSSKQNEFVEAIYSKYGMMDHDRLVFLTHSELPWNEARNGASPFSYSNEMISHNTMYRFYSGLLK